MKLGLHYWNYSTPADPAAIAPTLAETARIAEQAGVRVVHGDGPFLPDGGMAAAEEPMLEGYTTLGYVAGADPADDAGLLVTGVMYRHPGCWRRP